jgi:pimeloyl-ACP methyl ester carboxylesterase
MPQASRAGHAIHWTSFGTGPCAALGLHCSLSHARSWAGIMRLLGNDVHLTAFDLPGHGQSDPWQGTDEIQAASTAIAADFLDRPTVIIGHSFGATVALRLAVEHPDLVRALILYEPVFFAVALADQPQIRAEHMAEMAEYTAGIASGDMAHAAQGFLRVWGDGRRWDDLPEPVQAGLAAQMPLIEAAAPALYDDAGGMLARDALGRIAVPVLLIEGSASPAIIPAINDGLATRLPRASRAVIAGAGHMGPMTHPQQVASEMRRFLDRLDA